MLVVVVVLVVVITRMTTLAMQSPCTTWACRLQGLLGNQRNH